mgnify:FL=1
MAERVTVAKASELKPGQAKAVQVQGETIALFNIGGTYYAIEDTCTHRGGPLSEGAVKGTTVTCPWHGAQFNLSSGEVLSAPAPAGVKSYAVHIQGDEIQLEM